ncbi:hypothetical protein ES708_23094 [subsurface metagenome]
MGFLGNKFIMVSINDGAPAASLTGPSNTKFIPVPGWNILPNNNPIDIAKAVVIR